MDVKRLKKIIEFSNCNKDEITAKIQTFYSETGMGNCREVLNILQIIKTAFREKGFLVLELPFADQEIGALSYKGDSLGYIVLNTSLPKVNLNFAICHEIYHVFFSKNEFVSKVEFAKNQYYEHEEEYAANSFAGTLLMPEVSFRQMYQKFYMESERNEFDTILKLMNYYQVPYMAALIRCYELKLPEMYCISEELINAKSEKVRQRFGELWLDDSILYATKKDDFAHIEKLVEQMGKEGIENSYLNERTLNKVLRNMRRLYGEIKEESYGSCLSGKST